MFNRRGRGGGGNSYNQNAQRLRDKLRESRQENDNEASGSGESNENRFERHPPHLKGRDIGLWYARKNKDNRPENDEPRIINYKSDVTLPQETIDSIQQSLSKFNQERIRRMQSSAQNDLSSNNLSFLEKITHFKNQPTQFLDNEFHQPTEEDEQLCEEFMQKSFLNENYVEILEQRQRLPAFEKRQEIIDTVLRHQVVLIEGNTGCGKTTQVAQFLLDDALMNNRATKTRILCTQPRRIAATSIAKRVAYERCEDLGESVGYQIRLEKIPPRKSGSVLFCTTGVVLKLMEIHPTLHDYSHLIIDEIHERTFQTDLCLAILKEIIKYRKDLKVILMSATLNADCFAEYFSNCPKIHIEGFTFPVQDVYLEEIVETTGYDRFSKEIRRSNQNFNASEFDQVVRSYVMKLGPEYSSKTKSILMNPDSENVDENFIEFMIHHISSTKPPGAILIIVAGYMMISKVHTKLNSSQYFHDKTKFEIHAVHSRLTGNDQLKIFDRPPEGVRKIIISTPLCETSITIDDVVYVINGGKMKRPSFDFARNAKTLEDEWITKANETQRRGRAGRVQPGICYHLYTKGRSQWMEEFEKPEILRIRLEEVILTLKVLHIRRVKKFMVNFIDVPSEKGIDKSLQFLEKIGALDKDENLTPLGKHLSKMSVHPQIGKMLLFGALFGCFDSIANIAAFHSFKSPFYSIIGQEKQCDEARQKFCKDSDQIAALNAMTTWKSLSYRNQKQFCYENYLSNSTLQMLQDLKTDFDQTLRELKFLNPNYQENNQNSNNFDLIRSLICGGLYPNIGYRKVIVKKKFLLDSIKVEDKKCLIIPGSVNFNNKSEGFVVFHELQKLNSKYFLFETTTQISPHAILLFGDDVQFVDSDAGRIMTAKDIANFRLNFATGKLFLDLRKAFDDFLEMKIQDPTPTNWESPEGDLLRAIIKIITTKPEFEY